MRDLANLIAANAHAAGRALAHAQSDGQQELVEAIYRAQSEEIERFCERDHARLIIESPAADASFLAFNRGRRDGLQEG